MTTFRFLLMFCVVGTILFIAGACQTTNRRHNLILFVADGLRAKSATQKSAPNITKLRDEGVNFANSHSVYPTITMANGSAISTGHFIGDTGTMNTLLTS